MKIELEHEDIQGIATRIVEMIKPLLKPCVKTGDEDVIFDIRGLAHYLKVYESWLYKQVSFKAIPYFKCGKYIRFKKSAIDKWVESETVKPIPPLKMVNKCR